MLNIFEGLNMRKCVSNLVSVPGAAQLSCIEELPTEGECQEGEEAMLCYTPS